LISDDAEERKAFDDGAGRYVYNSGSNDRVFEGELTTYPIN